jgi:ABC-2 type transport system permease protein
MVVSIVTAIFISSEHSSGYIKNIAGQVKNKGMIVFAKFATLSIATFTIFVSYLAGAFVSAQIFLHNSLNYTDFMNFAAVIGVKYLLFLSIVAIIIFLCTLTKSSSLAIAFGVIFGTGITSIVYSVASLFLEIVTKHSIPVASFTPDGFAFTLSMATQPEVLAKGCALSVIYIVTFLLLSVLVMNKRDTR